MHLSPNSTFLTDISKPDTNHARSAGGCLIPWLLITINHLKTPSVAPYPLTVHTCHQYHLRRSKVNSLRDSSFGKLSHKQRHSEVQVLRKQIAKHPFFSPGPEHYPCATSTPNSSTVLPSFRAQYLNVGS